MRLLIFGNSGSGKSTLAAKLATRHSLQHLDLDTLAWLPDRRRRPLRDSTREIDAFLESNSEWVIEGCYGDLIEIVLPRCTELIFLNPGVETCVRNCRSRPWEPHKYPSPEAQNEMLDFLIGWVRDYEVRDDEFSLRRHRSIFDAFPRSKREILNPPED